MLAHHGRAMLARGPHTTYVLCRTPISRVHTRGVHNRIIFFHGISPRLRNLGGKLNHIKLKAVTRTRFLTRGQVHVLGDLNRTRFPLEPTVGLQGLLEN